MIQVERYLLQSIFPEFGDNHVWSIVTTAVCCSDRDFFLCFPFTSGHQGLNEQVGLGEDIRMLTADILSRCIAGSYLFCNGILNLAMIKINVYNDNPCILHRS